MKNYKSKICKRCGKEFKPNNNPNQKYCKECRMVIEKEYNKEYGKKWYKAYPEQAKEYRKQYCLEHSKEIKKWTYQWNREHPEEYKTIQKRHTNKRDRNLGFTPLNEYFKGSAAHHIDIKHIIYIPKELHKSVYHDLMRGTNMHIINALAVKFMEGQ